jgi:hypothetical protein
LVQSVGPSSAGRVDGRGVERGDVHEGLGGFGGGVVDGEVAAALAGEESLAVGEPGGGGRESAAASTASAGLEGFEGDGLFLGDGGEGKEEQESEITHLD